jgi:hypothetical protein
MLEFLTECLGECVSADIIKKLIFNRLDGMVVSTNKDYIKFKKFVKNVFFIVSGQYIDKKLFNDSVIKNIFILKRVDELLFGNYQYDINVLLKIIGLCNIKESMTGEEIFKMLVYKLMEDESFFDSFYYHSSLDSSPHK